MTTEADCNSNFLEVKRLQELIRKLERQNEELRIQTTDCTGGQRSPRFHLLSPQTDYFKLHIAGDKAETGEKEGDVGGSVLDEVELLDLGSLDEDEETW